MRRKRKKEESKETFLLLNQKEKIKKLFFCFSSRIKKKNIERKKRTWPASELDDGDEKEVKWKLEGALKKGQ